MFKGRQKIKLDLEDGNSLLFIKSSILKLRFFVLEEVKNEKEYIALVHTTAGHPGRESLSHLLKMKLYI